MVCFLTMGKNITSKKQSTFITSSLYIWAGRALSMITIFPIPMNLFCFLLHVIYWTLLIWTLELVISKIYSKRFELGSIFDEDSLIHKGHKGELSEPCSHALPFYQFFNKDLFHQPAWILPDKKTAVKKCSLSNSKYLQGGGPYWF